MKKGYTFLEVIVATVIVAILAMFAFPRFTRLIEKARVAEGVILLNTLRTAQRRYFAEHDVYPGASGSMSMPGDLGLTPDDIKANYFVATIPFPSTSFWLARVIRQKNGHICYSLDIDENGTITCNCVVCGAFPDCPTCADIGM
ncbi:MAG: prepilin-type N-terminal cleavage/methylation domain-containing protein [Candidatus Omnitrophota bacterium]